MSNGPIFLFIGTPTQNTVENKPAPAGSKPRRAEIMQPRTRVRGKPKKKGTKPRRDDRKTHALSLHLFKPHRHPTPTKSKALPTVSPKRTTTVAPPIQSQKLDNETLKNVAIEMELLSRNFQEEKGKSAADPMPRAGHYGSAATSEPKLLPVV